MLRNREVDAVILGPHADAFCRAKGEVVRPVPELSAEEERYFKKTASSDHAPDHATTPAFRAAPWIAMNLVKASRRRNAVRSSACATSPAPTPTALAVALASEIVHSGSEDPYPYGIEASRPSARSVLPLFARPGRHGRTHGARGLFRRKCRPARKI